MDLITTADVAARLRCTTRTVARLVYRGELHPAAKAPGSRGAFLFDPETIDAFAAERAGAKS